MAKISSYADGGNPAAADQFIIVRSGVNKKLVWNTIYTYLATLFALTAKGVTNGDSHDHAGGDGGTIAHASLSGIAPASSTHVTNGDSHDHAGGDGAAIGTTALSNDAVTYAKMQNVSATDKVLGRSSAGTGDVEEIACTAAARTLLASATAFIDKTAWTPTIYGTTDAGAGTYTTQVGYYSRIGNIVFVEAVLVWTAHTGTGNMRLGGLPIVSADNGISVPLTVRWSNVTLPAVGDKLLVYVAPNSQYGNIYDIAGGAAGPTTLDVAATLGIAGFYFA